MCLSPITIVNPTKYISLKYRDRFLLQVPCGHCAECQKQKHNEYYYRTYQQSIDCMTRGGFVQFITLTYSPKHLPHLSDYVNIGDKALDYPCFNSHHLRTFIARLRQQCKRKYNSNFSYFITSEYGTAEGKTHRPHYHALFFVEKGVDPLKFSALVSKMWIYGRTDGIPWKTRTYVSGNTFTMENLDHSLRCCRYVAKYVQKTCKFQTEIDRRITTLMHKIADDFAVFEDKPEWINSVEASRYRQKIKRLCNQFHRQSTNFGALALGNIDINQLMNTGTLLMPDSKGILIPIGLPPYYKRKLFYQRIKVDGTEIWQPTDLGLDYLNRRAQRTQKNLIDRYRCVALQYHLKIDAAKLADYSLNYRGRIKYGSRPSTLEERLESTTLFNYITPTDRQALGRVGIISDWIGNHAIGYTRSNLGRHYTTQYFAKHHCIIDESLEKQLSQIESSVRDLDKGKQAAFEYRQHLLNLMHYLIG